MNPEAADPFSFESIATGAVPSSLPFLNGNARPHSTEDTVTYQIYFPHISSHASSLSPTVFQTAVTERSTLLPEGKSNLGERGENGRFEHEMVVRNPTRNLLSEFKSAALKLVNDTPDLRDYVWHKESFGLEMKWEDVTWHLQGKTAVGDSIADEWLIVWILVQLSKQIPAAWIRVFDLDGEFLAAEAAEHIPEWLTPENDGNRVWINDGEIKIIKTTKDDSHRSLEILEALCRVCQLEHLHLSAPLTASALFRLPSNPSKIRANLHRSVLTIPRKLAWIIHQLPQSVSAAVEAFYFRDPISVRNLRRQTKQIQHPSQSDTELENENAKPRFVDSSSVSAITFQVRDLVSSSILFNRVGFAQLHSQEVCIPSPWADAVNSVRSQAEGQDKALAMKRLEMGIRLTTGYDLLLADPAARDSRIVQEIGILLQDIDDGAQELPTTEEMNSWSFAQREDDDQWMNIDWRDFEAELAGNNGRSASAAKAGTADANGEPSAPIFGPERPSKPDVGSGFGDKAAQENLRRIVERTKAFLEDESAGLDGFNIDSTGDFPLRKKPPKKRTEPMDVKEWLGQSSSSDDDDDADSDFGDDDDDDDAKTRRPHKGWVSDESDAESHTSSVDSELFDSNLRDILKLPSHYAMSAGTGKAVFGPLPPANSRNIEGRTVILLDRDLRDWARRTMIGIHERDSDHGLQDTSDEQTDPGDDDEDDDDDDINTKELSGKMHPDSKYHDFVEAARQKLKKRKVRAMGLAFPEDDIILRELERDQAERERERTLIRDRLKVARGLRKREGRCAGDDSTSGLTTERGTGLVRRGSKGKETISFGSARPSTEAGPGEAADRGPAVEDEDESDLVALSQRFESELRAAGALDLSAADSMQAVLGSGENFRTRREGRKKRTAGGAASSASLIRETDLAEGDGGDNFDFSAMPPLLSDGDDAHDGGDCADGRRKRKAKRKGRWESAVDEEMDVDTQVAANLLAALQSHPGAPGPASNLLGMLGLSAPVPKPEDLD